VGVCPPLPEKEIQKWRLRKFEIPEALIDKYFGEEDLVDSHFVRLDTLEEVESLMASWHIDCSLLDAPWKCDYPL
jgi:hypothetical protein